MNNSLLFALALAVAAGPALADNGVVTKPSKYSVAESMDRAEAAIKKAEGFTIFSRIDMQALASAAGGKVRPSQLLIFGKGAPLGPLLPTNPTAALDFPLKLLAWEDDAGKTWVSYNSGAYIGERHGVVGRNEVLNKVTGMNDGFAKKAAD